MTKSPVLWGAVLACAVGGAVAGNALGSTRMTDRSTIGTLYQTHQSATVGASPERPLPDHYPLVTRAGTVPVERLSENGLFRQARYRAVFAAANYANADPGPGMEELVESSPVSTEISDEGPEMAMAIMLDQTSSRASDAAKIIDVQTTLALR